MSYSDYGGLCWKFKDGEKPERYKPAEDASLHSEGPGDDRPLEQATGFKFDALLKADPNFGQGEPQPSEERSIELEQEKQYDQWLTVHAHHIVIGNLTGVGFVNHKGHVYITLDGIVVKECDWEHDEEGTMFHGGIAVPIGGTDEVRWCVQLCEDPYVSYNFIRYPDGTNYLAVGGYGVGEHWWLDDNNNEMSPDEGSDEWTTKPGAPHWPTEAEWLEKLVAWYNGLQKTLTA